LAVGAGEEEVVGAAEDEALPVPESVDAVPLLPFTVVRPLKYEEALAAGAVDSPPPAPPAVVRPSDIVGPSDDSDSDAVGLNGDEPNELPYRLLLLLLVVVELCTDAGKPPIDDDDVVEGALDEEETLTVKDALAGIG